MNRKGFTLLELLIALTLSTLVIYEIGALELSSRRTSEVIDVQADLVDELNIAFAHMRNRIRRAVGYRQGDGTHYGLDVFGGTILQFYLDEGATRNGYYDPAPNPDKSQVYRVLGAVQYYDDGDPTGITIAENIVANSDDPDTGLPIPVFQIVDYDTAHNQVRVTLTAERTVDGETYQATLQTLITARGMVS